jgi:pimeloyl-ACP methyl ester carboxylesterase
MLIVALSTVAMSYLGLCCVLFLFQRSFIYFPQPASGGGTTLILPIPDARVLVRTRPKEGNRAVIYFGGNAEDVSLSLPDISHAFPDSALYAMHYRGYGGSSGVPSQDTLFADALVLYDQVRATHPDIEVVGRSLGSGVAVYLASRRPVARLVLVTPFDSLQDIAASQFPFVPVRWLLKDKFESRRYAPQVDAPTLMIAADNDEIVPRTSTDLLRTRFRSGLAAFVVLPGFGHNAISFSPKYLPLLQGQ